MTQSKREPFAKATKHPTLDTWLVADAAGNNLCWADDSQAWEQWDAESRANSINAAFNARVDEEVRKAVAERDARIKGLEAEILESARLHGMGSQREAALKARIAELEKALEKHNKMHGEWTLILLSDGRVTNIPGFETEEACVCAGKNILLHWNWPYVKFVCVNTNGNVKGDR